MTGLTLHHALVSTCSQKVRFAMAHKRLPYHGVVLDLARLDQLQDDYLEINPDGLVPTLVHDGGPVTDSSVICEYLDDVFPETPLTPADARGRARMRAWMRHLEEVATPAVRPLSFNAVFAHGLARLSDDERARIARRSPLRRHFYARLEPQGFSDEIVAEAEDRLRTTFMKVDQALAGGSPYLVRGDMSLADVTLLPSVVRLRDLGRDDLWLGSTRVAAWLERMAAEPAFEAAYPPGSHVSPDSGASS